MVNLININIGLAIAHAITFVALAVYFSTRDPNFLKVGRPVTGYRATVDCDETEACLIATEARDTGRDIYVGRLSLAFFFITVMAHMIYALNPKGLYLSSVANENMYLRWFEYALSATIMILIIAVQSGISDESMLAIISVNTIVMMFMGQIVESNLASLHKYKKIWDLSDLRWKSALVAMICGWILLMITYGLILKSFAVQVFDVNRSGCYQDETRTEKATVPTWVWGIVLAQFMFYSAFGTWQVRHMYKVARGTQFEYRKIEMGYLSLSVTSKLVLGALLGYGASQSNEARSNTYYGCTRT